MERSELVPVGSPASDGPPPPPLTAVLYDVSHQVQSALAGMLTMTGELDQVSCGITEDIEKCKESLAERKKGLDEEKECVQKAAYTALQMLTDEDFS